MGCAHSIRGSCRDCTFAELAEKDAAERGSAFGTLLREAAEKDAELDCLRARVTELEERIAELQKEQVMHIDITEKRFLALGAAEERARVVRGMRARVEEAKRIGLIPQSTWAYLADSADLIEAGAGWWAPEQRGDHAREDGNG